MAHEHEIPQGGKLYFGKSAALKREIEKAAIETLVGESFEEIVTPFFSFHKYQAGQGQLDSKSIVRLADSNNNPLTLRADSSLEVVRIITKRLGRSTDHKKWFYAQPIFRFPSTEINQIGAEILDSDDVYYAATLAIEIFSKINLVPTLQLSNLAALKAAAHELKIDLEPFKKSDYFKLKSLNVPWLNALLNVQTKEELTEAFAVCPQAVQKELQKTLDLSDKIGYPNVSIAPLYAPKSGYYTDNFFRMLIDNDVLARGGAYATNHRRSCGFAIYTDNIIKRLDS